VAHGPGALRRLAARGDPRRRPADQRGHARARLPIEDFEQRAADISVDHPQVVDDYRAAHTVAEANERSQATTEDLRQALVHYRSLFEDLLEVDEPDGSRTADGAMARDEVTARDGEGSNDGRPSAASTPPERRTTEEAR